MVVAGGPRYTRGLGTPDTSSWCGGIRRIFGEGTGVVGAWEETQDEYKENRGGPP